MEPTKYEIRMANWGIEEDADCPNYQKTKAWAIANGYFLERDISYNGYIYVRKDFNLTDDPFDGNRIEVQVYKETNDNMKYHHWQQWDMEADFGGIMDPIKYGFQVSHEDCTSGGSKDLDALLVQVLQRERHLVEAHDAYKKNK